MIFGKVFCFLVKNIHYSKHKILKITFTFIYNTFVLFPKKHIGYHLEIKNNFFVYKLFRRLSYCNGGAGRGREGTNAARVAEKTALRL